MIRILHIGTKLCKSGGIETTVFNYYKAVDKNRYQFDFIIFDDNTDMYYKSLVEELGGRVYTYKKKGFIKEMNFKYNVMKNYSIIHIHTSCGIRIIEAIIARFAGVKHIIFHSHSYQPKRALKYTILIPFFRMIGNKFIACSENAGMYFFGSSIIKSKKFIVLKNSFDYNKYKFDESIRNVLKDNLNFNGKHVLGFVGRLSREKNIPFCIDVLSKLDLSKFILVIVGDGVEDKKLIQYCKEKSLSSNVIFLGKKNHINELLNAFDFFLLPSFYEGFGIALIEAQANGLYCVASDTIPKETDVTGRVKYLNVNTDLNECVKFLSEFDYDYKRDIDLTIFRNKGFYINDSVQLLMDIYNSLIGGL